jgi:hypothetical protein
MAHRADLLTQFTARFRVDEPLPWDDPGKSATVIRCATPREALTELRTSLPYRLPPLFEELLLTYRWPEADLGTLRLLANPVGPDLTGWLNEVRRDPVFCAELIPRGWVPFGKGPDLNYDPVCFDLRRRDKDGDCRVVRLDHEELLCNSRLVEAEELAPSFAALVREYT